MKRFAVLACCLLWPACMPSLLAQPPARQEVPEAEVEGLEGAKLTLQSVTFSVYRSFFKQANDVYNIDPFRLDLSAYIAVPREVAQTRQISSYSTVTRAQNEEGKDLQVRKPMGQPPPMFYQMSPAMFGQPFYVKVELPLTLPIPKRLNLVEAFWLLQTPAEEIHAEAEFKTGESITLGAVKVAIRKAEAQGRQGQFEAGYEIGSGQGAASNKSPLDFEVLDADGSVLRYLGGSVSYGAFGVGSYFGSVSQSFEIPEGKKPTRIYCTLATRFKETKLLARFRNVPIPAVP